MKGMASVKDVEQTGGIMEWRAGKPRHTTSTTEGVNKYNTSRSLIETGKQTMNGGIIWGAEKWANRWEVSPRISNKKVRSTNGDNTAYEGCENTEPRKTALTKTHTRKASQLSQGVDRTQLANPSCVLKPINGDGLPVKEKEI